MFIYEKLFQIKILGISLPQDFNSQLQKENERQKKQFVHLVGRISQMTQKMGELQEFDHRLKVMVNLETNEDNAQSHGVGGSGPDSFQPDFSN